MEQSIVLKPNESMGGHEAIPLGLCSVAATTRLPSPGILPREVTYPSRLLTSAAVTTVTACHCCPSVLLGKVEANASLPLMDLSITFSRRGKLLTECWLVWRPRAHWGDLIVLKDVCSCIHEEAKQWSDTKHE